LSAAAPHYLFLRQAEKLQRRRICRISTSIARSARSNQSTQTNATKEGKRRAIEAIEKPPYIIATTEGKKEDLKIVNG
jgi:hypothetical protein